MPRELTIQIRLSKQEHSTIAAQAGREGLGVGTYLRSLALRAALGSPGSSKAKAMAAWRQMQADAKARGLDKLSMAEIDQEIKAVRARRRGR